MNTTEQQVFEIEVSNTTIEKRKIKIPFYTKSSTSIFFYKILSEEKCLSVCNANGHEEIKLSHPGLAVREGYAEITEDEFYKKYVEVFDVMNAIVG